MRATGRAVSAGRDVAVMAIAAWLGTAGAALAAPTNLIQDGNFTGYTGVTQNGQTYMNSDVTNSNMAGWSVSTCQSTCGDGPNNLFMFNYNASLNGLYDAHDGGGTQFNLPSNGPGYSPAGGNAVASDADNETGVLLQTVGGLHVGDTYTLSFYQSTMDLLGYTKGGFQAAWQVGLGGQTQTGTLMSNPGGTASGWALQTMTFTATAISEALSFLATSPQSGEPPFLLLSGVSLTDTTSVPEPAAIGLLGAGLLGLMVSRRRRA